MKVLLIGARGFIGINLSQYLEECKHEVVPFVGKIESEADVNRNLECHPDAIINLAAHGNSSSHDITSPVGRMKAVAINVSAPFELINKIIRENIPVKVFITAGSSSEYGTHPEPLSLTSELRPENAYAQTKAAFTQFIQELPKDENIRFHVIRLFSTYGPYEKENRLIPTAFKAAMSREEMPLSEGVHDFVYVEDVCRTFRKILEDGGPTVTHTASGVQHTNSEVVSLIEKVTGKKIKVKPVGKLRDFDTTTSWVSDKESILLPPEETLQTGLEKTWQWLQKQS